jgi:hypothetical protein
LRSRLETIPEFRQAFAVAEGGAISRSLTFRADVLPWLGADVALAAWSPEDDPATVEAALLLASRDLRASNRFVGRLREELAGFGAPLKKRDFAEVTYWAAERGPAVATVRGFVVIATNGAAMKEVIALGRNRGGAPLAESPAYLETLALLPDERLLDFYFAPNGAMAPVGPSPSRLALGLRLAPDGLAVDTAARFDLDRLDPANRALLMRGPNPLRALGAMPDETVGAVAIRDLRAIWAATATLRGQRQFQENLASFKRSTGLDLEEDIISWLTGEVGMAAVEERAGPAATGLPVGGLLVIEAADRPAVEARVAKITEALARQGVTFAPRQVGGATMQVVEGRGGLPGAGYGYVDDFLVVGSSLGALGQAADVGAGALPATPRFRAIRAALPDRARDLTYLDMNAIRRIAGAIVAMQSERDRENYRRQVEPWLRPLAAIGSANAVTTPDGAARSTLFLLLEPDFAPGAGGGEPAPASVETASLSGPETAAALAQAREIAAPFVERIEQRLEWREALDRRDLTEWRSTLERFGVTNRRP